MTGEFCLEDILIVWIQGDRGLTWKHGRRDRVKTDYSSDVSTSRAAQAVKDLPAMQIKLRDPQLIPGSGRSPGDGSGYPLQYSCLENSMDGGAWRATEQAVAESQTLVID